ncbi:hypothetical protein M0805_003137 [Coniferiporia weirii]|nr:hypothetical protein M0805_003137 [Coniferiporia weirii]
MSANSTSADVLTSYDNTLGAILIGGFVSVFLYGVTCLQTFIYFQRYPGDRGFIKASVLLVWLIDSFDAALTCQICYYYLVSNYADPLAIFFPVWSLKLHVFVTSLSDFIVRTYFARRIYTLSHGNKLITGVILALSIVDLVVGTIITVRAFHIATFAGLIGVADLFYLNFASNISADTCVALVLCYYLWTNRTGLRRTDSLVVKLILYTVNTGMLTVLDAAAGLICYAALPTTLVFIAFYLNLSKFYVNSYLASLNVRKTLLSSMKDNAMGSFNISRNNPHGTGGGVSHNMPDFRALTETGGLSTNGAIHGETDLDTLDTLDTSKGGTPASTAVNTPTDVLPIDADFGMCQKRPRDLELGLGTGPRSATGVGDGGEDEDYVDDDRHMYAMSPR